MISSNGKTAPCLLIFPSCLLPRGFILKCKYIGFWLMKMCFKFHIRLGDSWEIQIISLRTKQNSLVHSVTVTAPIFPIFPPNVFVTSESCKLPNVYCIKVFRACLPASGLSSLVCANCSLYTVHWFMLSSQPGHSWSFWPGKINSCFLECSSSK